MALITYIMRSATCKVTDWAGPRNACDLRLDDNPSVRAAVDNNDAVIPVLLCPGEVAGAWSDGADSCVETVWFVMGYHVGVNTVDPSDPPQMTFALKLAVKRSGLSLADLRERLQRYYGVEIIESVVSRNLNSQDIGLQRAMQILAILAKLRLRSNPDHRWRSNVYLA